MIIVTGQQEASQILTSDHNFQYVISIGALESEEPHGFSSTTAKKLRLLFDDVNVNSSYAGYCGCTIQDIQKLIDFCLEVKQSPGNVLVHCAQGVSRSTASTLVLLHVLGSPDVIRQLQDVVAQSVTLKYRSADTSVHPNCRVIALADTILGSDLFESCLEEFHYFKQYGFQWSSYAH